MYKILIHELEIINFTLLLISQISEEVQEYTNKYIKKFRKKFL